MPVVPARCASGGTISHVRGSPKGWPLQRGAMGRAHREVEIKLEVPPAGIKRLKRHLRRHPAVKDPPQTHDLTSVYFDTKRLRLRREGFSLRVRDTGARRVQTVKQS